MVRASYKKTGRKIHGMSRKKKKNLADLTTRPQRGGDNTNTGTTGDTTTTTDDTTTTTGDTTTSAPTTTLSEELLEIEIKIGQLQYALVQLNDSALFVNTRKTNYDDKLLEVNGLTVGSDEYNQNIDKLFDYLYFYNLARDQYNALLSTYRTLEAELNTLREAQSLSTSTYEAETFSPITPPTTTAPDPMIVIQTVRTSLESNKTTLNGYKDIIETNRLILEDVPDDNNAMTLLNQNIGYYNNLLTSEYNPNVTRYRELEAQINASQVGSSTTTLQTFETPTYSTLNVGDILNPPNVEISYIPASTSKLNDYHIMMYMLYLFNNPDIKDKLNLNSASLTSFDTILKTLRDSTVSDPDFNSVLTILATQINRIKSIPALQQDIKNSIGNVKSVVQESNNFHVALRREINEFLSSFL